MSIFKKPGVIVSVICAAGALMALAAAAFVGADSVSATPLTGPDDKVTCPNKDGQKVENCPKDRVFN